MRFLPFGKLGHICAFLAFALGHTLDAQTSPTPNASPSPVATAAPTAVPLGDAVAATEAANERLDQIAANLSASPILSNLSRDLLPFTSEIEARLTETKRLLAPGVALETMRDLEARWQKLTEQLSAWTRDLNERASYVDRELAQLPELRATWKATLDLARSSAAPTELTERVEQVSEKIVQIEAALRKHRAQILSWQTRVAEQMQRVQSAARLIKSAQSAAVNQLWTQDSPPIWNAEVRSAASRALTRDSQVSFGEQAAQLRAYAKREWEKFIYLALIFLGCAAVLIWIKNQAARWTEKDAALERANRVLSLPLASAGVLTFLFCRPLFAEAPRPFWLALSIITLLPVVLLLRRVMPRYLFPILYVLVAFYLMAQLRAFAASLPVLSRFMLLVNSIGGTIFLLWFIRSTRVSEGSSTARKATRAGARTGLLLFAVVFFTNALGYVGLANYLGAGAIAAAYLAILLYAAAEILEGLIAFALQIRPFTSLSVVRQHRALLRQRIGRAVYFLAFLLWVAFTLNAFSLREAVWQKTSEIINAEIAMRSLHLSLGAVLAFALTIWFTLLLSRFIRFLLEEEIYSRFRLARGSSYAVSTLLHYVILLVGFYAALAAVGADMTRFAILAGAFGVGIGFGLQNIFNNFFSGLILLFERPVQLGDVIEVGGVTGLVRRIGIRASVILLADSSQLIIPNGQLISEKVTNRTRSSRQKTLTLHLRVAYGTDPQRVIALLAQVASAHPLVLQKPAAEAFLKEFGTDALLFDLNFTTEDVDHWLRVQSDVAVAVASALREAGIETPFPRSEVHLAGAAGLPPA